jgi:C-terminal processing protease CtpA/Prc
VLRLPSFAVNRKPAVDQLVNDNRTRLLSTPYLVIDVRGNGGGWTDAYSSVMPLLYTDPIFVDGMDAWASPGNIASVRALTTQPPK